VNSAAVGKYRIIAEIDDRQCRTVGQDDVASFIAEQLIA
jgi:hypothetical protein